MSSTPSLRRRWIKRLGIILGSVVLAVLLAIGGTYVWLWCWSWKGDLDFHESWSGAERTALTQLEAEIHQGLGDVVAAVDAEPDFFDIFIAGHNDLEALLDDLHTVYIGRNLAAELSSQLHRIARSGQGADDGLIVYGSQQEHQTTLSIFASAIGKLQALEALVAHGADPNTVLYTGKGTEAETPLTLVINGRFLDGKRIAWEERQKTADFLLQHGADINGTKRIIGIACDMSLMLQGESAPWLWALSHGKTMSIENLCHIVASHGATPVLEHVLREKSHDINDASGKETVLQALLTPLRYLTDDEAWQDLQERQTELRLDMLLAAGARPDLLPEAAAPQRPGESDDEYIERLHSSNANDDLPVDIVLDAMEESELPQHRELCQRILDKLRTAGAQAAERAIFP